MGVLFLAIAAAGIAVFGCWRMFVGAVAARAVSDRLRQMPGPKGPVAQWDFHDEDFAVLERLFVASGALAGCGRSAVWIRRYYSTVRAIRGLFPVLAPWSEREMTVCSLYLAARIKGYLASNAACTHRVHYQ
jgi:hypothetical protein